MPRLDRRTFLAAAAVTSGAGVTGAKAMAVAALKVEGLRAAQLVDPLGLGDRAPALSWRIVSGRRGVMQVAYRIRAATSAGALAGGKGDLWDSGRIESTACTGIAYGGASTRSRQRIWWSVTVWDDRGNSATAAPAFWECGLLDRADWSGDWIAAEDAEDKADRAAGMPLFTASAPPAGDGARLFRLPFASSVQGETMVTLFAIGFLRNLTVDGQPVAIPGHPYIAFGGPPAMRFTIVLSPGKHMLAVEVTAPRSRAPVKDVAIAAQLRLPEPSGVFRLTEGWQTAMGAAAGWRMPGSPDEGWAAPARQTPQPHPPWPATPAVLLRTTFDTPRKPVRARLHVAALGACELRLNGRKVGDHLLESESSDFRKTILARSHDVTAMVQAGTNAIGAIVGDGWYASYAAPVGRYPYGPAPRRLLAQLELEFADGSTQRIASGSGWRLGTSPIRTSEIYNGEVHDARLEQPGWDTPGFDDSCWVPCWIADVPPAALVPHAAPPIRATRTLKPKAVTRLANGDSVVDFGQNFAGVARISVKGTAGIEVVLRFAEMLKNDGSIDQSNLRAARVTDRYMLRGDPAGEVFVPRFTYHGFRYVQISDAPDGWAIEGLVTNSDLPETGLLRIGNPLIEKLWLNTLWSQRSNFVAVPTDCPQRDERLGWTGDAQVFWDSAAFNMDIGAFTRRFLHDLRDAQGANGAFPIFAPTVAPTPGGTPGWSDAGVMLPWIAWRRYGDTQVIAEHWDSMRRYVAGVIADNPDFVWRVVKGPDFSDWLALDARQPGDEITPRPLVGTAMLKRTLDQLADMGDAIGKAKEAAGYRAQSAQAVRAFQAAFVKPDGTVGNGSHTGYILAIRLGMLTPEQWQLAGRKLVADIRRRGTLLSTGFLGTPVSLDALADIGAVGLIYDLLLRTEFPGWGYMVSRGATTIWERWNGDTGDVAMNSFNHYALGAVCGFLFRRVAGIEETAPGFAAFRVKPLIDPRVPSGGGTYDSVRGRIETRWRQSVGRFRLDLTVPANSRAEVHLPVGPDAIVLEAGKVVGRDADVRIAARQTDRAILTVGSGTFRFEATG